MLDVGKMVDAVLDVVDKPLQAMHERLKAVEQRPLPMGERGDKGEPGADGKDGAPGIDGKDGPQGERGSPGEISLAPDDVAIEVASTIAMLAESPPVNQRSVAPLVAIAPPTPRSFVFERDADGKVIAAREGDD